MFRLIAIIMLLLTFMTGCMPSHLKAQTSPSNQPVAQQPVIDPNACSQDLYDKPLRDNEFSITELGGCEQMFPAEHVIVPNLTIYGVVGYWEGKEAVNTIVFDLMNINGVPTRVPHMMILPNGEYSSFQPACTYSYTFMPSLTAKLHFQSYVVPRGRGELKQMPDGNWIILHAEYDVRTDQQGALQRVPVPARPIGAPESGSNPNDQYQYMIGYWVPNADPCPGLSLPPPPSR